MENSIIHQPGCSWETTPYCNCGDDPERIAGNDALVRVILAHRPSGFVSSRDGWIECECGERLPCPLDSDGYAVEPGDEDRVRAEHLAAAILTSHIPPAGAFRDDAEREEYARQAGVTVRDIPPDERSTDG